MSRLFQYEGLDSVTQVDTNLVTTTAHSGGWSRLGFDDQPVCTKFHRLNSIQPRPTGRNRIPDSIYIDISYK